jgi:multiple sugar transport system permease protein
MKHMARTDWQERLGGPLALVAISTLTAILIFPIYWMLQTALLPTSMVLSRHPSLLPTASSVSIEAFAIVLGQSPMLLWFFNSCVITLGSAVLGTVACML